jgi:hypothetical protein
MLAGAGEDFAGPAEAVAGIKQAIDLRPIPRPLLDFVEVAVVGIRRAVRLFVEVDVVGFRFFGHWRAFAARACRNSQELAAVRWLIARGRS